MKLDLERLAMKLEHVQDHCAILERIGAWPWDRFSQDRLGILAMDHAVQTAIQAAIDVAMQVANAARARRGGRPASGWPPARVLRCGCPRWRTGGAVQAGAGPRDASASRRSTTSRSSPATGQSPRASNAAARAE